MRFSQLLLPTERQPPADAEALSHKLMVRAGLVRQVGAGLWSWLPAGWRVHQNAVQIVREEIDAIGGQEMLMPVITPADLWKRSGRYDIAEVFKLKDRRDADLVLAMTHEETITTHIAQAVRSYRDLPMIVYHFQTKGRDEPRPRAGVLRTREFIMKDSYSLDRDWEGLDAAYQAHYAAYERIFERCGLEFYACESDVGMMGGTAAHEFMAPCAAGENDVAIAPGYSANVEIATAEAQPVPALELSGELHTPGATTMDALAEQLGVPAGNLAKAFPIVTEKRGLVMVFVRGDHQVNEIKLANALGEEFRPARDEELPGPAGSLGPTPDVPALVDEALGAGPWVVGALKDEYHRVADQIEGERVDVRRVVEGDLVNGHPIRVEPAIEIGNIFKLGTRFSEPLGATYLDADGKEQLIVMGSYGIGPARIAAAAVEQFSDDKGISWPKTLAPWDVEVVALGKPGTQEREVAERVYADLRAGGFEAIIDERDAGPGEKFADAELLGCPLRLTIGGRSVEAGAAEAQKRRGLEDIDGGIPLDTAAERVRELWGQIP